MRNLKKFLALVLAMMMVLSLMITVNASGTPNVTEAAAIRALQDYGVLEGYPDGSLHESDSISRAQMAAIIYRAMTGDIKIDGKDNSLENHSAYASHYFSDINKAPWAAGYIGFCANHGILVGFGDGKVNPNEKITGYQVLAMLLRALGYGQRGEYVGDDWTFNVMHDATKLGLYAGVTFVNQDPGAETPRSVVAQMTYNAVRMTSMVEKNVLNEGYRNLGTALITDSTANTDVSGQDVWGAYTASRDRFITFNWSNYTRTIKTTTPVETLQYEFWGAITECDLADALDEESPFTVRSYTNGVANVNLESYWESGYTTGPNYNVVGTTMTVQPLDTVNKVGHEGRWNRVYLNPDSTGPKYIIVGVDTFMGIVTETWGEVKDPNGHVIIRAGANVNVYYNAQSVGSTSNPAQSLLTEKNPANLLSLTVYGNNFTVGQKIGLRVATATNGATMAVGTVKNIMDKTTANASFTPAQTGAVVVSKDCVDLVTADNVTIQSITYDSATGAATGTTPVGFVGTNGQRYYYNYTFAGTPLTGAERGKTYTLWLGHKNENGSWDVLDYKEVNAGSGYGVVSKAVAKSNSVGKWYLTYTFYGLDGLTHEIDVIDYNTGNPQFFGSQTLAEAYFTSVNGEHGKGALIHYTKSGDYYVFDVDAKHATETTKVESGRAGAIGDSYNKANKTFIEGGNTTVNNGALVNADTVFFVGEYKPDTSTPTDQTDYLTIGYQIYTDFRTIPNLEVEANTAKIDGDAHAQLDIWYFDVDANDKPIDDSVTPYAATDYAKYVVVNYATEQPSPTASSETIETLDYALIVTKDTIIDENDGFYEVPAYMNGQYKADLMVRLNAGKGIPGTDVGLYSIDDFVNNQGYSSVILMDGTKNGVGCGVPTTYEQLNMKIPTHANFNYSAGVLYDAANARYLTVVKGVNVYRVNRTQIGADTVTDSVLNVYGTNTRAGANIELWYQVNKCGQIDTIYIVDGNMTGATP